MGVVAGSRPGGGAGTAREICDGLLATVGALLRPRLSSRAPPLAAAAGGRWRRPSALFAEFLVELEQRLCKLPAYQRQCSTQWPTVSPGRLYRIPWRAIWRLRAVAVRWPLVANRNLAGA